MLLNPSNSDAINKNFIELFGHVSINEIIADWPEIALSREQDPWVEFPPQEFLDFVLSYPKTPFDSIPDSANYLKTPSFLLTQTHRLWQTSSRVFAQLTDLRANRFIDFGSFPFFLPFILRDFFGFKGEILATVNFDLSADQLSFLKKKDIQIAKLDLDPFVCDPYSGDAQRLPLSLDLQEGFADMILASHVIEHLYHPRSLAKEAKRLLKPGGRLMLTTDNAMMIDTFVNYIAGYGYTFEGIESTAAMTFHSWRGHVRFFTERDISTLVQSEGFNVHKVDYFHCFYEIIFEEYFKKNQPKIAGWKREVLAKVPWLRNDISVVACR